MAAFHGIVLDLKKLLEDDKNVTLVLEFFQMSPRHFLRRIVAFNLIVIVLAILLGLLKSGNPSRYFGEGRFTTFWSATQLLAIAGLSWLIFIRRHRPATLEPNGAPWFRRVHCVWLLMAVGFVFLAADELFELHERMDRFIIRGLDLPRAPLTDRLDDAIMASYGLIGLAVLWLSRRELVSFQRVMRGPMIAGFICLFLGLLCDTASNDDAFFHWLTGDLPLAKKLNGWFSAFEGALTLLPEGLFTAAFYAAWITDPARGFEKDANPWDIR